MTPSPPEARPPTRQTTEPTTIKEWEASFHDMADLAGWHQRRANKAEVELRELQEALTDLHEVIEEYILWEPGRSGHAAAHRKLVAAALAASSEEPG